MAVSDHRTELTANVIQDWAKDHKFAWHYIIPGKPTHNGYVESFNGHIRDEF